jgi:hypothetical protein
VKLPFSQLVSTRKFIASYQRDAAIAQPRELPWRLSQQCRLSVTIALAQLALETHSTLPSPAPSSNVLGLANPGPLNMRIPTVDPMNVYPRDLRRIRSRPPATHRPTGQVDALTTGVRVEATSIKRGTTMALRSVPTRMRLALLATSKATVGTQTGFSPPVALLVLAAMVASTDSMVIAHIKPTPFVKPIVTFVSMPTPAAEAFDRTELAELNIAASEVCFHRLDPRTVTDNAR